MNSVITYTIEACFLVTPMGYAGENKIVKLNGGTNLFCNTVGEEVEDKPSFSNLISDDSVMSVRVFVLFMRQSLPVNQNFD